MVSLGNDLRVSSIWYNGEDNNPVIIMHNSDDLVSLQSLQSLHHKQKLCGYHVVQELARTSIRLTYHAKNSQLRMAL